MTQLSPKLPLAVAKPPTQELSPGFASLPVEVLCIILAQAATPHARRRSLLELAVTCKAFTGPAIHLLHERVHLAESERAQGFIEALQRSSFPNHLAAATRCLSITYRTPVDSKDDSAHPIPSSLALRIFYVLHNLRRLEVDGDDDLRALESAIRRGGGGLGKVRTLKMNKVRWDRLVQMLERASKLEALYSTGLYEAELPSSQGDDAVGGQAPPRLVGTDGQLNFSTPKDVPPQLVLSHSYPVTSGADAKEDDGAFPLTLARPPSPTPLPPPVPPAFPLLPLRRLTLNSPAISSSFLLALLSSARDTLEALALISAPSFSREGLILGLRSLPNLLELDISDCQFSDALENSLARAGGATSPPLPHIALPAAVAGTASTGSALTSTTAISSSRPITSNELSFPFDYLAQYCPFLQWLKLESEHLGSDDLLANVAALPLQCLSLGLSQPAIGVAQVENALLRLNGRLEALVVSKSMRWNQAMVDEARKACVANGVVFCGEVDERRTFPPTLARIPRQIPLSPAMADTAISSVNPGDKYIGLALAISSSVAIGTSFIITKKGLISAADQHDGFSSDSYSYFKNGLWWAGMLTIANFAAYTFAPPVLVTPLGALSVLIGAVLAAFFLGERLGRIGISGCALCLVGSIIIVLHSPEDKEISTVDEVLDYALQPGFMFYCFLVLCYSLYAIYKIAPKYGTSNPLVYISICSLVGSVSVMAVKGFGVALKLTFAGNNQLWRAGTWIFAITVVGCIAVQMNYFNKALDLFPTTVVNPSYFVGFSSCTLLASIILFHGLNTTGGSNTVSLLCGLFVICLGVYLLNLSRSENESGPSSRRFGDASARHSLLESGLRGGQASLGRMSLASDSDPDARRSTNLYRGGGAVMGGVEPLFDYERAEGRRDDLHMDRFALREDDEGSDEEVVERIAKGGRS
ncbi:hypothetical protein JCM1841_006673 [Sporobolomyces salmonicolor]